MSFMRNIMESTVRNMSPAERHDAVVSVAGEVARTMTAEERAAALVALFRILSEGMDNAQRAAALHTALATEPPEGTTT